MTALATTSIAWILLAVVGLGWIVYAFFNVSAGRREIGSELELAANRTPYYPDEILEGRRLTMVQLYGVILLAIIVIALPLYWVLEPNRQAGATEGKVNRFAGWGADLFATTEDGGFNCAGCHGGMNATGGEAAYTVTNPLTDEVQAVQWKAPALNTALYRFDESEIRFILDYGRPGSPMAAWGLDGGGPMNFQQVTTLIAYIASIQIPREECSAEEEGDPLCESGHLPADEQADIEARARQLVDDGTYASYGEALFNNDLASGAYSCARCHTQGWSYDMPGEPGQGAFGWNLTAGSTAAHFPDDAEMEEFISLGSELGQGYGRQGQGSGRMPAFGQLLTDEQIAAVVDYVRSL
ncbi:MAG: cytochrome c [Actinomycetota bacterium]|nr:cytochrome c [Acidimicrobiia bacterium]MDQ3470593.1 cytochrome c [Actinomycetota bacterium]